jgi:beta-galactosidase/beta-glucuronidase
VCSLHLHRPLEDHPDIDAGLVHVQVQPGGQNDAALPLVMAGKGSRCGDRKQETDGNTDEVALPIPDPKLWSPDSPFLYDLEVSLGEDRVESYFGMRKFSLENQRLCLNGVRSFNTARWIRVTGRMESTPHPVKKPCF